MEQKIEDKSQKHTKTVVTACDHNYAWGAMLLGLSLRYFGIDCLYHVLGYNLTDEDIRCLESIPDTAVFEEEKSSTRSVCTQKPQAFATADTELVIWMDSDCMVIGDVNPYLTTTAGVVQIRFRDIAENASVYRNQYAAGDEFGSIPQSVQKKWQEDVGDLEQCAIRTVGLTNCFVVHRNDLDFIKKWREQMDKVITDSVTGVYAKDSFAYPMTDESVINSLFGFYSKAPKVSKYLLDQDPKAYCVHFGLMPKPWQKWTKPLLEYYDLVQDMINWGIAQNISMPELPAPFRPENKFREIASAYSLYWYRQSRYKVSSAFRFLLRRFRG